jgi:myosin-5
MAHNYDVGTRAWQPDPTEGWVASQVVSKTQVGDNKVRVVFELENGEVSIDTFVVTSSMSLTMPNDRQELWKLR